jgi:hypothetical protein
MLEVSIQFDFLDEEYLKGRFWDCSDRALRERGLSYPISTGMVPPADHNPTGLPWIPRKLILVRPTSEPQGSLSEYSALNVAGTCAVGLIVELLPQLPNFDEKHFRLKNR